MNDLIDALRDRNDLDAAQIEQAAGSLLDESVELETKAEFLRAFSDKGETPAEIAGLVNAFLERAVEPVLDRETIGRPLLDVCGTGGDKLDLFNVSTTCVFVLAACGVGVVKHGNRGITSKSGGADVLEALGIRIDLPPEQFGDCMNEVGAGFLFAQKYHPAFKTIGPVRKQLADEGRRTVFNLLGPLLNPARPEFQLIGVFDESLTPAYAEILRKLGRKRAWAVHGHTETGAGMDELSSVGSNTVHECTGEGGLIHAFTIEPAELGLAAATVDELKGGGAEENAALLRGILDGSEAGPKRDIVLLNAAAGLTICGLASDLREGLARGQEAIDSGAATAVLKRWQAFSESA